MRKYLSQERRIIKDFNACIYWVAFFIGFILRVNTAATAVQL
jgi:hypothetical protein